MCMLLGGGEAVSRPCELPIWAAERVQFAPVNTHLGNGEGAIRLVNYPSMRRRGCESFL
jgi:hypothetical protein